MIALFDDQGILGKLDELGPIDEQLQFIFAQGRKNRNRAQLPDQLFFIVFHHLDVVILRSVHIGHRDRRRSCVCRPNWRCRDAAVSPWLPEPYLKRLLSMQILL